MYKRQVSRCPDRCGCVHTKRGSLTIPPSGGGGGPGSRIDTPFGFSHMEVNLTGRVTLTGWPVPVVASSLARATTNPEAWGPPKGQTGLLWLTPRVLDHPHSWAVGAPPHSPPVSRRRRCQRARPDAVKRTQRPVNVTRHQLRAGALHEGAPPLNVAGGGPGFASHPLSDVGRVFRTSLSRLPRANPRHPPCRINGLRASLPPCAIGPTRAGTTPAVNY